MIALGAYDGLLARAVRQLKFDGRRDLARPLGQALGAAWSAEQGLRPLVGGLPWGRGHLACLMGPNQVAAGKMPALQRHSPGEAAQERWRLAGPMGQNQLAPLWIPVPSHPSRLRSRGYDHTALLARAACRTAGVGRLLPGAITRVVDTPPLYRLTRQERAGVLAGAFVCPRRVAGPVILLDDILTTGATAREAAEVLRAAGATRVDLLVVARA